MKPAALHDDSNSDDNTNTKSIKYSPLNPPGVAPPTSPPYDDDTTPTLTPPSSSSSCCNISSSQLLAMISNYSTSYNAINIGLTLDILAKLYPEQRSPRLDSLCASSLLAGMIVGQLIGGMLGDGIGRFRALSVVMALQVVSSVGSALVREEGSGGDWGIYYALGVWRFVLGVGCGGVYPLAAVISAEDNTTATTTTNNNNNSNKNNDNTSSSSSDGAKSKNIALVFSTQGLGFLSVPLFTWLLVSLMGEDSDLTWRIVLGAGCVPGLMLIVVAVVSVIRRRRREGWSGGGRPLAPLEIDLEGNDDRLVSSPGPKESLIESEASTDVLTTSQSSFDDDTNNHDDYNLNDSASSDVPPGFLQALVDEPNLCQKLLGTAGTWFLFDILFYGNTLFQPVVLSEAFGSSESISQTCRDTSLLAAMALPGYFVSFATIGTYQTPKYVQIQGFVFMAVLYAFIGFFWDDLTESRWLLLLLYGLTFFFANYGPNATTFMLPSTTYGERCRSTLNGVSAAAGKFGALLGAIIFEPVEERYGEEVVMYLCAGGAIVALFMTKCFVR